MGLFGFGEKKLQGRRLAIICTYGVEQVELTSPKKALERVGAMVQVISPHKAIKGGKIKAWNLIMWGDKIKVDVSLSKANVADYDGLHIPGGVINPDLLRTAAAVEFVRAFFDAGKPVSSICHGHWMLIEADVVQGRELASWPSLKTDLMNAGAEWVDKSCVEDDNLAPAGARKTSWSSIAASSTSSAADRTSLCAVPHNRTPVNVCMPLR